MDIEVLLDRWAYEIRLQDSAQQCKALSESFGHQKRSKSHEAYQNKERYLQLLGKVDEDEYGMLKIMDRQPHSEQMKKKNMELIHRMQALLSPAAPSKAVEATRKHAIPRCGLEKRYYSKHSEEIRDLEDKLASQRISRTRSLDEYYYNRFIQREKNTLIHEVVQEELEKITLEALEYRRALLEKKELDAYKLSVVQYALEAGPLSEKLISKFNVELTRRHMQCLAPLQWVNDEIINFWMQLLQQRDTALVESQTRSKVSHFFNSFFYSKLCEDDYTYANVRRWTRKIDMFKLQKVFVPVNISNTHWCLAVIDMDSKSIQYFDSMNAAGFRCLENLLRYLEDEMKDKLNQILDPKEWNLIPTTSDTPQQENGCDCGIFTCIYAHFVALDKPLAFSQKDISYYRQWMTYNILCGSLDN